MTKRLDVPIWIVKRNRVLKNNKKYIVVWSPDYSESTGQAFVTKRVVEKVLPKVGLFRERVFLRGGKARALLSWFVASLKLWGDVAFGRTYAVYLVCSRSNFGFFRDVPALVTSFFGVRVFVHVHGSDIVDLLETRKISGLALYLYRNCDLILPSAHLEEPLRQKNLTNIQICENFAQRSAQKPFNKEGIQCRSLVVLWNSNIMASKGVFDVCEAVCNLRKQKMDIKLSVMGSVFGDQEMSELDAENRLKKIKGCDAITIHGRLSQDDALKMLNQCDVVALPSRYSSELQPLALIQAMATGKAVIASDTPALKATLAYYPAELVPLHSVEAITSALLRLIEEKATDPIGFVAHRALHAKSARARFAPEQFDHKLSTILGVNN